MQYTGDFRVEVGALRRYHPKLNPNGIKPTLSIQGLTAHITPGIEVGGQRVHCSCQCLICYLSLGTE